MENLQKYHTCFLKWEHNLRSVELEVAFLFEYVHIEIKMYSKIAQIRITYCEISAWQLNNWAGAYLIAWLKEDSDISKFKFANMIGCELDFMICLHLVYYVIYSNKKWNVSNLYWGLAS